MTDLNFKYSSKFKEVLEFSTQVLNSHDKEQRASLRPIPLSVYSFFYQTSANDAAKFYAILESERANILYVPIFSQRVKVNFIGSGDNVITVDTTDMELIVGGRFWIDYKSYEIQSFTDSQVTITTTAGEDFTGVYVCPARQCYAPNGAKIARDVGFTDYAEVSIDLESIDAVELSGGLSLSQYAGVDVFDLERTHLKKKVSQHSGYFDISRNKQGGFNLAEKYGYSKNECDFQIDFLNLTDLMDFKKWLHSIYGMLKPFWLPTWQKDFTLTSGITSGDTVLNVEDNFYNQFLTSKFILIRTVSGNLYRKILSSTATTITVDTAINENIATTDNYLICYLFLMRFNSDKFTFNYELNNYCSLSHPVVEVNDKVSLPELFSYGIDGNAIRNKRMTYDGGYIYQAINANINNSYVGFVRKIDSQNGVIAWESGDVLGTNEKFSRSIDVDSNGDVYVKDALTESIIKLNGTNGTLLKDYTKATYQGGRTYESFVIVSGILYLGKSGNRFGRIDLSTDTYSQEIISVTDTVSYYFRLIEFADGFIFYVENNPSTKPIGRYKISDDTYTEDYFSKTFDYARNIVKTTTDFWILETDSSHTTPKLHRYSYSGSPYTVTFEETINLSGTVYDLALADNVLYLATDSGIERRQATIGATLIDELTTYTDFHAFAVAIDAVWATNGTIAAATSPATGETVKIPY